jgi:PAS domain S-box-containing protein
MHLSDTKPAPKLRILVVDDNKEFTALIGEVLQKAGYEAIIEHSGNDALDRIRQGPVDLVLLDIIMPDKDGITVAREMKEFYGLNTFVPIILISALHDEKTKIDGLTWADDYLTKPFSFDEFLAHIKAMLRIQQLQKELQRSQTLYQRLYENLPEMCITLDSQYCITDCNEAFCRTLRMEKNRIVGQSIASFFDGNGFRVLRHYLESLKPLQIIEKQVVLPMLQTCETGEAIQAAIKAIRMDEDGAGLIYIIAMQDMTRNIRLEWEQKNARIQLYRTSRLASIGTLASGVAHELNNPLAAILGFSDALLHRLDGKEELDRGEFDQYLRIIVTETLRCRDIVENLSRFARESEPRVEQVSLLECVDSTLSLIKPRMLKSNITLVRTIDPAEIVTTDVQKIGQVILNVLTNALDFSANGGTITIDVENPLGADKYVRVRITDTGPGIPSDALPRIFDPFYTTKEVGRGLGLGLAISHKIMEDCEGGIDISSEPGQGTTVTLEIPRH